MAYHSMHKRVPRHETAANAEGQGVRISTDTPISSRGEGDARTGTMNREGPYPRRGIEEIFLRHAREDIDLHQRLWKNQAKLFDSESLQHRLHFALHGPRRHAVSGTVQLARDARVNHIASLIMQGRKSQNGRDACSMLEIVVHCWDQLSSRVGFFYVFKCDAGYVDQHGRFYRRWQDWQRGNPFPSSFRLCFPSNGTYRTDATGHVILDQCAGARSWWVKADGVANFFGLVCVSLALVCAIAPINVVFLPFLRVADGLAAAVAAYLVGRDIVHLLDRYRHHLPVGFWRGDHQRSRWIRIAIYVCNLFSTLPVSITHDFVVANMVPPPGIAVLAVALSFVLLVASTLLLVDKVLLVVADPHLSRIGAMGSLALALIIMHRSWESWLNTQTLALEVMACSLGWSVDTTSTYSESILRLPRLTSDSGRRGSIFFADAADSVQETYAEKTAAYLAEVEDIIGSSVGEELFLQTHVDLVKRFVAVNQHYAHAPVDLPQFELHTFRNLPLLKDGEEDEEDGPVFLSADRFTGDEVAQQLHAFRAREHCP